MIAFWAVYMALEVHKREDKRCTKQYGIVTAVQVGGYLWKFLGMLIPQMSDMSPKLLLGQGHGFCWLCHYP